ncbi:Receptor-like kinase lip2 [Thalictrum thalictroides]|uniref:Receptor-like kinase lip2 n=1 Tax=Thalictrum thalictroides TaxID=46969 RepID=A0A7J6XHK0_THATH|nr:Receptor-like kinase lip2 [Thalictrum thalictroides]
MLMMSRRSSSVQKVSNGVVGGGGGGDSTSESGGRTVVVGLKLDSQSKELLTWALVKVAEPGDQVFALHILNNSEVVNGDGNSSLLSLVKAFDSILGVYEGFCNLKQIDLKLKICRGSCTRKVLVREAKACFASKIIVGTSRKHHGIGLLSTSVARYCARKLSKDCWILAVNNGKVVFQREVTGIPRPPSGSRGVKEDEHPHRSLLGSIHRSLSKNHKVLKNALSNKEFRQYSSGNSPNDNSSCPQTSLEQHCRICSSVSVLLHTHCTQPSQETSGDGAENNSLALVPVQTQETCPRSVSLLIEDELRHDWPLRHQEVSFNKQICRRSEVKEVSIVHWAMRLPSRYCSAAVYPDHKLNTCEPKDDRSCSLDGESGAIVLVGDDLNPLASPDREAKNISKEDRTSDLDAETGAIVLVGDDHNPSASPARESKSLPKELESLHEKYSSNCRLFQYKELLSATFNFLPEKLIGSGGSSHVYKGCLPDGKELAVKILKPSEDIVEEFVLEIEIITTLNHKNIVSLFGFCFEDSNLLLVYDFLARGSLEENLHCNKKEKTMFGWADRYKVALGVAEALDYLHNGNAQSVIHRDVKSSNILLSDDFEPQLSDFGLAKWASTSTSHITCTDVAGTFGYLAPEYFMYGKLNDKVDVYAYGVVLLELLSGRTPINNENPKGQESLVMWAKPILNGGKVKQLLDPSLGENYDSDQMERMVLAASLCIRRSPRTRPGMNHVLKLLQGDAEAIKWSRRQVSALDEVDGMEDEGVPSPNFQSHLNLALRDVEDDSLSFSSVEQNVSLEDYLQGRWSRTSSFD